MEIISVKDLQETFLLNDVIFVPKVEDNSTYQLILEWIAEGNTPAPQFTQEELDVQAEQQALQSKISLGKNSRLCCEEVKDLIAGYNLSRSLTLSEINQMLSTFAAAKQYLDNNMAQTAKAQIEAINPDGVIVTEEMKQDALNIFVKFGI
jgi:hypothetical protein